MYRKKENIELNIMKDLNSLNPNKLSLIRLKCYNCKQDNRIAYLNKIQHCKACKKPLFYLEKIDGYIYVLSNDAMPNLFKIGFTKNSVKQRVSELNSSTSIPEKFEIQLIFACKNPKEIEKKIHTSLIEYRANKKREFFSTTFEKIYNTIKLETNNEPVYTCLYNMSEKSIKNYCPWNTNIEKENKIYRPSNFKNYFTCPKCKNTTRKKHHNMNIGANYYCKRCKISYDSNGAIVK